MESLSVWVEVLQSLGLHQNDIQNSSHRCHPERGSPSEGSPTLPHFSGLERPNINWSFPSKLTTMPEREPPQEELLHGTRGLQNFRRRSRTVNLRLPERSPFSVRLQGIHIRPVLDQCRRCQSVIPMRRPMQRSRPPMPVLVVGMDVGPRIDKRINHRRMTLPSRIVQARRLVLIDCMSQLRLLRQQFPHRRQVPILNCPKKCFLFHD